MAVAVLAKGLYLVMLREAAKIAGLGGLRSSPRKVRKASAGSSSLVRNVSNDDDDDAPALLTDDYDTVTEEAARWAALDKKIIR